MPEKMSVFRILQIELYEFNDIYVIGYVRFFVFTDSFT